MTKVKHYFILSLLLVMLDQVTKLLIYGYIKPNNSIIINDFFNLTHVHNYGAAFSFLADQSGWQRYFLSGLSAIASIAIMIWMRRVAVNQVLTLSALSILLAGAVGNLIDRFFLGFVDLILLTSITKHFIGRYLMWPIS
jgi:lipoprotein signal peptidase